MAYVCKFKGVDIKIREKLFGGTVPPNNLHRGGTVPPNNLLFGGTLAMLKFF